MAATLADLPKATDLAPGSSEKSRASEAGGRKGLSVLQELQGPAAHSINGKTKPWEPFMAEEFAHQFHESVLQSTQKALQRHKGGLRLLSQCSEWSLGPAGGLGMCSSCVTGPENLFSSC